MKKARLWIAFLFALLFLPAFAQEMPPVMSDTMVDTLHVKQYGSSGSPIILIPGLAAGAWTWSSTVMQYSATHVIYVVTLPGFDGMAPPAEKTGYIDKADDALAKLIVDKHLDHPILVGHSLGGTLALLFATAHSDLISGLITVEGLPVAPGTEDLPRERRGDMGVSARAKMDTESQTAFAAQQMDYAKSSGVMDPEMAEKVGTMLGRSDPYSTAQYLGEVLTLDFRPALSAISVPVLLIVPYNPADGQQLSPPHTQADKVAYYRALMAGTPKLEVVSITPARHFVMFDQRDAFLATLGTFFNHLGHPS
jgi:pimeloyl-ACP methyl ester carboxylesterase